MMKSRVKERLRARMGEADGGSLLGDAYSRFAFRTERRLLAGRQEGHSDAPSTIHYSINKSATQYVKRILFHAARDSGLKPVNWSSYASWHDDLPYLDRGEFTSDQLDTMFPRTGHVFAPLGSLTGPVSHLAEFRVVLVTRDPRDVLTSEFFSTAFSHPMPRSRANASELSIRREKAAELGIDRYVVSRVPDLLDRYVRYVPLLEMESVLLVKYEDLVSSLDEQLDAILNHTGLRLSRRSTKTIQAEASAPARGSRSKRRQVVPGDHRRQLSDDTRAEIDDALREVMLAFGYGGYGMDHDS